MISPRKIYVISDTHFGHANIIKYCGRPFADVAEMDEALLTGWNETVRDQDIVYHLGDVYFGAQGAKVLPKLKGRKRLLLGNHDVGKDQRLLSIFQKIGVWRLFPEYHCVLTHLPIVMSEGPKTESRKYNINIHGHMHNNCLEDSRYINACVEHTNYKPIELEEILA